MKGWLPEVGEMKELVNEKRIWERKECLVWGSEVVERKPKEKQEGSESHALWCALH